MFITELEIAGNSAPPALDRAVEGLRTIQEIDSANPESTVLMRSNRSLMIIAFGKNLGYYVSAIAEPDFKEKLALSPNGGKEELMVEIGGQGIMIERCYFIEHSKAVHALTEFFENGRRSNGMLWIAPYELKDVVFVPPTIPRLRALKPDSALGEIIGNETGYRSEINARLHEYLKRKSLVCGNILFGSIKVDDKLAGLFSKRDNVTFKELLQALDCHLEYAD